MENLKGSDTRAPEPDKAGEVVVVRKQLIHRVELLEDGGFMGVTSKEDFRGRTLEDIAKASEPWKVVGVREFKRIEVIVEAEGRRFNLKTKHFDVSGIIYPDGKVLTVDEYMDKFPQSQVPLNIDRIVRTRTGAHLPFKNGDRILETCEIQPKVKAPKG